MTALGNPTTFKSDWLDGFAAAYGRSVRKVPGAFGVVHNEAPARGKVAVVIGGGCGHYPAFAGLVGPGLATAAVIGDVFTSPSAEQVYRTAKAADGGAGVLFGYGNYAGDVMHFGLAGRRLAAEGVPNRTILVTDDIASGPADTPDDRRGVAGDFLVFKVAGAAAQRGDDLDTVHAFAAKANAHTRTYGAAFGGCTLPGADAPLFTVDPDTMELGLGIHGEPGVRTVPRMGAEELADTLVAGLLPELPVVGDGRVVVLLNGLGRTKYEEMFVAYKRVHRRLAAAGLDPCRVEVGEFVTSLDMAGLSLSIMVVDDELAELYAAPCDSPAFRISAPADRVAGDPEKHGGVAAGVLAAALRSVEANAEHLGHLDAVAADGDHGIGMVRGLTAAVDAADAAGGEDTHGIGAAFLAAGTALADAAGGASGALYGVLLAETGGTLLRAAPATITLSLLAAAVTAAQQALVELGKAELGQKTMLDALDPFRQELARQAGTGAELAMGWQAAAEVATKAAAATADLTPAKGRAARLVERSRGHADPGATSFALIVTAIGTYLTGEV